MKSPSRLSCCYFIATLFPSLLSPLPSLAWEGQVAITTPNTQLLLHADEGKDLRLDYYGPRVCTLDELRSGGAAFDASALPAFGTVDMVQLPALQVQHVDGDLNLDLEVVDYSLTPLTPSPVREGETSGLHEDAKASATPLSHGRGGGGEALLHMFVLKDRLQPLTVRLFYKAYKDVDIIETWTEITNGEKKAITLKRYDSGHLVIRQGDVWLTHLHGNWAAEAEPTMEPLTPGVKIIRNSDGARNAHLDAPEVMLSLDGRPQEQTGRVIGAALCWSGNYELRVNTLMKREHHFYAGIDPQSSEYVLDPKETFTTPHLALTFSTEGMGGVSRTFHRWARTCGMLHRGMNTGDILLNSWEGLYFDINEERMLQMMDDIAGFGGELFVMDDGWFGDKYPRNDDTSSLGDWMVDRPMLPGGIKALTDAAAAKGIKFGIWIEPEAVNTKCELYEKHPEWALQTRVRELKLGRGGTQLVLDMTNPEVQDFVVELVEKTLSPLPREGESLATLENNSDSSRQQLPSPSGEVGRGVSYIKWDANASIQNVGSLYLPKHKQNNLYVDYHLGLLKVLQRIREKYPDVVIQDCASGGGRANYGLLPYFDEFWVSDNTDALQRVYIQWGTSLFFPANAMACHINHCPYWNTGGRVIPIKFRCDVAMSGRLGIELQPKDMTDEERQQCTTCFCDYKELRPIVQTGDLYRLISPYDGKGVAALMYKEPLSNSPRGGEDSISSHEDANVTEALPPTGGARRGALFIYKLHNYYNQPLPRIRLAGLDPARTYTLIEKNVRVGQEPCALSGKQFSGRYLMDVGIEVPLWEDYASRVFELQTHPSPSL